MRKVTVKCDRCGFEKTYDDNNYACDELKGWATVSIYGPYKDAEICPECVKSFFDVKEVKDNDKDNN